MSHANSIVLRVTLSEKNTLAFPLLYFVTFQRNAKLSVFAILCSDFGEFGSRCVARFSFLEAVFFYLCLFFFSVAAFFMLLLIVWGFVLGHLEIYYRLWAGLTTPSQWSQ